jgi:hypothetical protein
MESSLTPREIQTRIRSGESFEDIVKIAGLSAERVEAFAAPVLAERSHIAALALSCPVRRAGQAGSHNLRQVAAERLISRGLDIDQVDWDAWRRSDGRWVIEARHTAGGAEQVARFVFDAKGRFSTAENDAARWLIGDPSQPPGPPPIHRSSRDPDSEPTVDYDQATPAAPHPAPPPVTPSWLDVSPERLFDPEAAALAPGQLSDLDSLYDFISVIQEDSVRIYRGLREPLPDLGPEPSPAPTAPEPADESASAPVAPLRRRSKRRSHASVPSWDEIMFGGPDPTDSPA